MALKWDWLKEPEARRALAISFGILVFAIMLGETIQLMFGESLDPYKESMKIATQMMVGMTVFLAVVGHYLQRQRIKRHEEYLETLERIDREISARNREHPEASED